MKLLITSIVFLLLAILLSCAEMNYKNAINSSIQSEGSDGAIEMAMYEYGFELAWHEEPTLFHKIKALFNEHNINN